MAVKAADEAFSQAGLSPSDVDVVELHDCFSTNELIMYEALVRCMYTTLRTHDLTCPCILMIIIVSLFSLKGLCGQGKGGDLVDSGNNTYGGTFVINPSGGLISKGHPLGATGLAQCSELTWQVGATVEPLIKGTLVTILITLC